jgi:alcohol dehydrogenase (cytochrome c)
MKTSTRAALRGATATILGGAMAVAIALPSMAADVTKSRLANADAEPENWLMGFQNYSSHRYSGLSQINKANVASMRVAYTIPLTTALVGRTSTNLQNYPLVDNGIMFVDDGAGLYYKIDVTSGLQGVNIWKADAALEKDIGARSRGIAMYANAIFHNLEDGRVVSIDRDSGEFNFDLQIARVEGKPGSSGINVDREGFTAAPIAVNDMLLVGNSKGDAGSNGWLAALDIESGDELWRTYMIPGPGEFGHDTWADDHNAWKTGGAGLWTTGSIDLAQNLTIWGTAQPVPMFDPEFRPGDNLYTNSAIAMDLDDGSIRWFFQYVPNESWDYDEQGVHMLIDAVYNGVERQMVTHFARNGYYYQLDRTNGDFLSASQFVDQITWTAGIDPKTGKPVEYDPSLTLQTYIPETRWYRGEAQETNGYACPDLIGGVRWQPMAYNPVTQIAYSAGIDGCFQLGVEEVISLGPDGGIDFDAPGAQFGQREGDWSLINHQDLHGLLAAVDVTTGKVSARLRQQFINLSGVLATAGGLVFTGGADGAVTAHDDGTLAELWRFHTGIAIKAPPITFAVGGRQFVAIIAGGPTPGGSFGHAELEEMVVGTMLYVFSL